MRVVLLSSAPQSLLSIGSAGEKSVTRLFELWSCSASLTLGVTMGAPPIDIHVLFQVLRHTTELYKACQSLCERNTAILAGKVPEL